MLRVLRKKCEENFATRDDDDKSHSATMEDSQPPGGQNKSSKNNCFAQDYRGPPFSAGPLSVEKILGRKLTKFLDHPSRMEERFLIKWKNTSYLHSSWEMREYIEAIDVHSKGKMKRFLLGPGYQTADPGSDSGPVDSAMPILEQSADGDDPEEDTEYVNPDFIEVHRIISCNVATVSHLKYLVPDEDGVLSSPALFADNTEDYLVQYLVKWRSLPYNECTWEFWGDLKLFSNQVKQFWDTQTPPLHYTTRKPHPNIQEYKKLDDSVTFGGRVGLQPRIEGSLLLRDYQLEGVNWLLWNWWLKRPSILADEMGLGKTIQTIAFLDQLRSLDATRVRGPFLVVAPLSLINQWQNEIALWSPSMNCITFHGGTEARNIIVNHEFHYVEPFTAKSTVQAMRKTNTHKFDILVTTYEMAIKEVSTLSKVDWQVLIVDEAHRLKNPASRLFEQLALLPHNHCVLLTGTPLQNKTEELWALLHFADRAKFSSQADFVRQFGDMKDASHVAQLHTLLKPYLLRRIKEDVEKSLPPKEETIIEVSLTSVQKKYYKAIYEKNTTFLFRGAKTRNQPSLVNIAMELRKCCNHPFLIKGAEANIVAEQTSSSSESSSSSVVTHTTTSNDSFFHTMISCSGKLILLDKLLPKLFAQGHKVLIFSQMVKVLNILSDFLRYKGYSFERLDGNCRGEERNEAVSRFCKASLNRFVMLLSTRAGGLGLNLVSADTVIIFDSDWNPHNDVQAQARAHRIGQTKSVMVYRLLTKKTYEMHMFHQASMKLGMDRAVLAHSRSEQEEEANGAGQDPVGAASARTIFNAQEIDELLKRGAYDVFREEDSSDQQEFEEADIDSILLRRTQKINYDGGNPGGTLSTIGSFSKASFVSADQKEDIDINDPDFWCKAIGLQTAPSTEAEVLVALPQKRKRSVNRFLQEDVADPTEILKIIQSEDREFERERRDKDRVGRDGEKKSKDEEKKEQDRIKREKLAESAKLAKAAAQELRDKAREKLIEVKEQQRRLAEEHQKELLETRAKITAEAKLLKEQKEQKTSETDKLKEPKIREAKVIVKPKTTPPSAWGPHMRDRAVKAFNSFGFGRWNRIRRECGSGSKENDFAFFLRSYVLKCATFLPPDQRYHGRHLFVNDATVAMKLTSLLEKIGSNRLSIPPTLSEEKFVTKHKVGGVAAKALMKLDTLHCISQMMSFTAKAAYQAAEADNEPVPGGPFDVASDVDAMVSRLSTLQLSAHLPLGDCRPGWFKPASWWNLECDRHLIIGTYRHGYGRWDLIRDDPTLIFSCIFSAIRRASAAGDGKVENEEAVQVKTEVGQEHERGVSAYACDSMVDASSTYSDCQIETADVSATEDIGAASLSEDEAADVSAFGTEKDFSTASAQVQSESQKSLESGEMDIDAEMKSPLVSPLLHDCETAESAEPKEKIDADTRDGFAPSSVANKSFSELESDSAQDDEMILFVPAKIQFHSHLSARYEVERVDDETDDDDDDLDQSSNSEAVGWLSAVKPAKGTSSTNKSVSKSKGKAATGKVTNGKADGGGRPGGGNGGGGRSKARDHIPFAPQLMRARALDVDSHTGVIPLWSGGEVHVTIQHARLSSFKGVYSQPGSARWICLFEKPAITIGCFDNELDAAMAYDKFVRSSIHVNSNEAEALCNFTLAGVRQPRTDFSIDRAVLPSHRASKYRGVRASGSRWTAQICFEGGTQHLGTHGTELEAAIIYDDTAIVKHARDLSYLNFPDGIEYEIVKLLKEPGITIVLYSVEKEMEFSVEGGPEAYARGFEDGTVAKILAHTERKLDFQSMSAADLEALLATMNGLPPDGVVKRGMRKRRSKIPPADAAITAASDTTAGADAAAAGMIVDAGQVVVKRRRRRRKALGTVDPLNTAAVTDMQTESADGAVGAVEAAPVRVKRAYKRKIQKVAENDPESVKKQGVGEILVIATAASSGDATDALCDSVDVSSAVPGVEKFVHPDTTAVYEVINSTSTYSEKEAAAFMPDGRILHRILGWLLTNESARLWYHWGFVSTAEKIVTIGGGAGKKNSSGRSSGTTGRKKLAASLAACAAWNRNKQDTKMFSDAELAILDEPVSSTRIRDYLNHLLAARTVESVDMAKDEINRDNVLQRILREDVRSLHVFRKVHQSICSVEDLAGLELASCLTTEGRSFLASAIRCESSLSFGDVEILSTVLCLRGAPVTDRDAALSDDAETVVVPRNRFLFVGRLAEPVLQYADSGDVDTPGSGAFISSSPSNLSAAPQGGQGASAIAEPASCYNWEFIKEKYFHHSSSVSAADLRVFFSEEWLPHCSYLAVTATAEDEAADSAAGVTLEIEEIRAPNPLFATTNCSTSQRFYSRALSKAFFHRRQALRAIAYVLSCEFTSLLDYLRTLDGADSREGMPVWWDPAIHDVGIMLGCMKYGYLDLESTRSDIELPFCGDSFKLHIFNMARYSSSLFVADALSGFAGDGNVWRGSDAEVMGWVEQQLLIFPSATVIEARLLRMLEQLTSSLDPTHTSKILNRFTASPPSSSAPPLEQANSTLSTSSNQPEPAVEALANRGVGDALMSILEKDSKSSSDATHSLVSSDVGQSVREYLRSVVLTRRVQLSEFHSLSDAEENLDDEKIKVEDMETDMGVANVDIEG